MLRKQLQVLTPLKWEVNIKTDLRETIWEDVDRCICSGQAPVAGSSENGNEPSGSTKGGEFFDQLSDY
jgi:hypothetical protein